MTNISKLFSPLSIGNMTLAHRIAMAPMTRLRATQDGVVTELTAKYYSQRSTVPGTFIISEAAAIATEAGGFSNLPGIHSDTQVAGWKKVRSLYACSHLEYPAYAIIIQVVDAVHANGSYIYLQIGSLGRVAHPEIVHASGHPYVSSSPTKLKERSEVPVELSKDDIERYIQMYAEAAARAVHEAGFDGIELHACKYGALLEYFGEVVLTLAISAEVCPSSLSKMLSTNARIDTGAQLRTGLGLF